MTVMSSLAAPENTAGHPFQLGATVALAMSTLLSSLGVSIANAALPSIAGAFGASFSDARWVVISYLSAITVMVVAAGWLGDLFGKKRTLLFGVAVFSGASVLCGLSPSLNFLIWARILQGVGGAISIALSQALVIESVPNTKLGRTIGLLGTMSAVGTALGPSLSGFLVAAAGWRSIFLVLAPIGLLALAFSFRYLPAGAAKADVVRKPFTYPLRLVKAVALRASLAMNAIVSTVMMSTLVVGPFYLSQGLGLSERQVGLAMSLGPCLSILSGIVGGRLVDFLGASSVILIGLGSMAAGAASLAILPPILGIAGYMFSIVLLSPGYQMFLAANGTAVMAGADADQRGLVSGALNLSRNLGLITGASVMGAMYAAASGGISGSVAATAGLQATFMGATVLALFAIAIASAANRAKQV